ncbi:cell wall glycoside hydrolase YteR [Ceratobasidium sp. AG-Ba]|nr:cell wall glycoside hydrolase YteR [Ceratobasidium sp. AG-Ba]QRW09813.1 cell wall glycoside hydrolase YteR [Ceratobasidium sp. AG-Ba]
MTPTSRLPISLFICVLLCFLSVGRSLPVNDRVEPPLQLLSSSQLLAVETRMLELSKGSWELGTATQSLLEFEYSSLSVFGGSAVPPPSRLEKGQDMSKVLAITDRVLQTRPPGILSFMQDNAAGDPPSLGVSMLLANFTVRSPSATNSNAYDAAIIDQLNYILTRAPRAPNGAISHRVDQVQVWSDSVYMVPPFLAYFAALHGDAGVMRAAYDQVRLYRDLLFDGRVGLWRHIALGNGQDLGHWSTGNAWVAAGIMRVLATLSGSPLRNQFVAEQGNLQGWALEIIQNIWKYQQPNGTLLNYATDSSTFADSASTALLAAATYRLASFTPQTNLTFALAAASKARSLVSRSIDANGYLLNVVDPWNFPARGTQSAEGQAFVLNLEAAYRDYQNKRILTSIRVGGAR